MNTEEDTRKLNDVGEKYLTFRLGNEGYAMSALNILEIIPMQPVTPVPQMPQCIKGVLNLRGKVVSVVDLRVKFGIGDEVDMERTCNVIVEVGAEKELVGVTVDEAEEVVSIAGSQIEEKPDLGMETDDEFILGFVQIEGGVKAIIDIEQLILSENRAIG